MKDEHSSSTYPFDKNGNILTTSSLEIAEILSGDFWTELRVFLALAKGGSYIRASEILNVTSKTVSRHVKRLQDVLGAELVETTQQGIILTTQGHELANQLSELDYKLFKISQNISSDKLAVKSYVRIGVTDTLGAFFVAPSLYKFSHQHSDIGIDVRSLINAMDIRENNVDLMISPVPMAGNDLSVERMGTIHFVPIASKQYIETNGQPTLKNLANHWFIHSEFYDSDYWLDWKSIVSQGKIRAKTDSSFSYGTMVKTGLGIGMLATFMTVDPALKPMPFDVSFKSPLYIITPKEQLTKQPVRSVRSWLTKLFSEQNPWFADNAAYESQPNDFDYGLRRMLNV